MSAVTAPGGASAQDDAEALLRTLTGGSPDGMWSAPGRANLIGEHTDYNDGLVLPFAIGRRTHAAVARRADGRIRVASTAAPDVAEVDLTVLDALFPARRDEVPEWARYPLGVAWALILASGSDAASLSGVDMAFASDVPVGAGLSSSAALEGAAACALNDVWGLGLDRLALAGAGTRAENEAAGAPTGVMDQIASLWGEVDAAVFIDCRTLETRVVPLGFAEQGYDLVVIDTGVKHAHSTGGYSDRRAACSHAAAVMGVSALRDLSVDDLPRARELLDEVVFRRLRHVVTENQRVVDTVHGLHARWPSAVGLLLDASHASMRDDFEISIPELDLAVDSARAAGAIGARMTGGGFGGAAIALVPVARTREVTAAVAAAFDAAGFAAPTVFPVSASEGGRRDR